MESSICTRKGSQTASSSSPASSASSSSSTPIWKHEVFLSFHGPDTRLSFTDHLYDALKQKGILTFRDDEKLERGKDISQELFKAIQESLYAIVILSPNYATSKWCLKELAEIVKCKTQTKLGILPIFCDVDPSDVRKQTGTYKKAFDKHAKNPETESWRAALTEVGNIAGWDLRNRHQATVIQQIVGDIFEKLSLRISSVHGELVGIDSRVMEMMNFIGMGLNDVRFIGIHGMGGVGKTTLSEVIYNSFSHQFEGSSYLASVRESSGNQDLVCLQQKLLCQILKESEFNVGTVSKGATMIRNRMQHRKILIVLDDVSTDSQLEALAGSHDWFGLGSRIIITSRDSHLLKRHGVTYLYEIDVLNNDEALKLFSLSAFKKVHPDENYMDLSKSFIKYAKGLPLALKVLGSSLFGRTTNAWKRALNQLKENPMKKILVVLEIGFDGLEDLQKKLFLDIAFFFKGEKLNGVVRETLESSGYYPDINIEVLKDKSLITVSHFGTLEMYDLLQEMGKEIVRHESPIEPGQRSRLCNHEDVLHVLKNNTGTNAVEGIVLKMPPNKLERLSIGGFSKMKKLRILKVDSIIPVENLRDKLCARIGLRHPLKFIPTKELRILEWDGYPLKSLPTNFQADKLVELNFKNSLKIKELWRGRKGRGIFDFIMTGASLETSSSRCSEWFNNTTTTAVDIIDYEFIPRMNHPKLKGCSLFFLFEYHGPVIHSQFQTKPPFQPQLFAHDRYLPFGTRTPLMPFACIFERDEGIPSEPLFLWAPVILGIGPIEFWAFVPATRFLEFLRWRTCSSCIGASVVPLKKHRFFDNYYFPSKETKGEISLKEWEDPHGTCWDVIDGDLWKDPFVDVKDCRVRLVYEDDVSQFYSTVAPHALHSKYYEHPCYHPSPNG